MSLRVGFIGCVTSSKVILEALVNVPDVEICGVITKEASKFNADFFNLSRLCVEHNIPYIYERSDARDKSVVFFRSLKLDVIYCFGWSYLLDSSMLSICKLGVIGFHPAALPLNRGRHPIIWAIALGLEETASTFFQMDEGADSGPILSQVKIEIEKSDTSKTLYDRIMFEAIKQVKEFTAQLAKGSYELQPQDSTRATSWRKRSVKDGMIDWRMTANGVYDLVRALSPPYPCAEFHFQDQVFKVPKCRLVDMRYPKNLEPGLVLQKGADHLVVKVWGDEAVWVEGFETNSIVQGDYL